MIWAKKIEWSERVFPLIRIPRTSLTFCIALGHSIRGRPLQPAGASGQIDASVGLGSGQGKVAREKVLNAPLCYIDAEMKRNYLTCIIEQPMSKPFLV